MNPMNALQTVAIAAAPFRLGAAAIAGWSTYLATLSRRGAHPLDVAGDIADWWRVLTDREPPRWAHPWPVAHSWPLARLRDCSDPDAPAPEAVPTLLLPPQSGSHSCIVDLSSDRSQVSALRSGGLSRLYCLDWAPAGPVTDGASLDDHLAVLAEAVELLGGRVNLVGGSQGGWLAAMHAALHPRTVHSLTVAGAPIDFHADRPGAGALEHVPRSVSASVLNLWYDASRLFGVLPTDPVSEVQRSLELLGLLNDPDTLGQAIDERRWFLWRQEIPAAFRTWILEHLFVGNDLVAGAVTTAAGPVDLAAIECPVHIVLGRHDLVVPPGQVLALADHVSTPAGDITVHDVDAGHLGLFVGRRALTELWPRLAAGIAAHSR
ncbi:hypothetical protein AIIKEEIJ_02063 [Rhodococcus sp. YH1]|nr:hypothetical protein [Rhodococcus sp. YH1]